MLRKIRLRDFKSFVDEEIELAPLTFLVGANASGKSNFLDAIRFLRGINSDLTIAEVLDGEDSSRPDAWPGIRGRAQEAARVETKQFSIQSTWQAPLWPTRQDLQEKFGVVHSISCQTKPFPRLVEETFGDPEEKETLRALPTDDALIELYSNSRSPVRTNMSIAKSVLKQEGDVGLIPGFPDLFLRRRALWYHLERVRFLEHKPERMRGYGRRGYPLGEEGASSEAKTMRGLGAGWKGLLQVCPELQELRDRIRGWLESRN